MIQVGRQPGSSVREGRGKEGRISHEEPDLERLLQEIDKLLRHFVDGVHELVVQHGLGGPLALDRARGEGLRPQVNDMLISWLGVLLVQRVPSLSMGWETHRKQLTCGQPA
eukprot:SAG25_NODE_6990_length_513_cov_1.120773_1_plen_110_part_10